MGAVTQTTTERIDTLLQWLIGHWSDVPEVVSSFEQLDPTEKEDYFVDDIPMAQRLLNELKGYVASKELSDTQTENFNNLLALITQNSPIIERLLAD